MVTAIDDDGYLEDDDYGDVEDDGYLEDDDYGDFEDDAYIQTKQFKMKAKVAGKLCWF